MTTGSLNTEIWGDRVHSKDNTDGEIRFGKYSSVFMTPIGLETYMVVPVLLSAYGSTPIGKNEQTRQLVGDILGADLVSDQAEGFGTGKIVVGQRLPAFGPGPKNVSVPLWIPGSLVPVASDLLIHTIGADGTKYMITPLAVHQYRTTEVKRLPREVLEVMKKPDTITSTGAEIDPILSGVNIQPNPVIKRAVSLYLQTIVKEDGTSYVLGVLAPQDEEQVGRVDLGIHSAYKLPVAAALINFGLSSFVLEDQIQENPIWLNGSTLIRSTQVSYKGANDVDRIDTSQEGLVEAHKPAFYTAKLTFRRKDSTN